MSSAVALSLVIFIVLSDSQSSLPMSSAIQHIDIRIPTSNFNSCIWRALTSVESNSNNHVQKGNPVAPQGTMGHPSSSCTITSSRATSPFPSLPSFHLPFPGGILPAGLSARRRRLHMREATLIPNIAGTRICRKRFALEAVPYAPRDASGCRHPQTALCT